MHKRLFIQHLFFWIFFQASLYAQLQTNNSLNPQGLVQNVLLGNGVTVSNVSYNGSPAAIAQFTAANTTLGINSGIVLTTGTTLPNGDGPHGPNDTPGAGVDNNMGGFNLLSQAIQGTQTYNAAILEFDFVPYADTVRFKYVFGSDEYPEFAPPNNTTYNDVFGFFISGPGITGFQNIALLPNGAVVSINNVNTITNPFYFVNNGDGNTAPYNQSPQYIQYDGFTKVLEAVSKVQCGQTYHLIIAIADVGDGQWDSGIFLEANSLSTLTPVEIDHTLSQQVFPNPDWMAEGCVSTNVTLTRQANLTQSLTIPVQLSGTATSGIDYNGVPASVTFQPGQTTVSFTIQSLTDALLEGLETLTLTFPITDPCGNVTPLVLDLWIQDNQPMQVTLSSTPPSCPGDPVTINSQISGGVQPYTYLWSTGQTTGSMTFTPSNTTTVWLEVTDACTGIPAYDTLVVNVPVFAPLAVVVSPDITEICPYVPATIGVQASGGSGQYTYLWSVNSLLSGTMDSLFVNPGSSTTYLITVSDNCGNSVQDSVIYTILSPPLVLQMNGPFEICPGDSVDLLVTATGGYGTYYYNWSTTATTPGITVAPQVSTSYFVQVSDECQTFSTTAVAVVQVVKPLANFYIATQNPMQGLPVQLTNASFNAWSYAWSFGDGNGSFLVNPTHVYTQPGAYEITLIATDQKGCLDSISKWIEIAPERYIYLPNSFTPDGDGLNEYFYGRFIGLLSARFYIFNRWGEEIFFSDQLNFVWNGEYEGVPVQDGTYSWYLIYEIEKGIYEDLSGHVNVIR
ncbi:MAG: choice-of-anchor L domain-containing protein [Flavobacteriia bacterium]|jgi:gliding motility-associated-like protein|nr:choice-of-anchor L domain-containing protein [Cryomorphaceae bacterium]